MASNGNGSKPEDQVNIFTLKWKISNVKKIIQFSEGNFHGVVHEPFVVFNNLASMKLCWRISDNSTFLLIPSVDFEVHYPLTVMVRIIIHCTRYEFELTDGAPWTVVPDRVNVWKTQCKLESYEFLIDDSITMTLSMINLPAAKDQTVQGQRKKVKADQKPKDPVDYRELFTKNERTDFTIIIDEKEINCHKCVLATTSTLLSNEDVHLTENSLKIYEAQYNYDIIYQLISFLYTMDESKLNLKSYAKQFLALSHNYNVKLLKAAAELYLINEELCLANARAFARLGCDYKADRLRLRAEYMIINAKRYA